jgi:hypothetical protein
VRRIFPSGMEKQNTNVMEEYCWAITHAVVLRPIRLQCVGVWISTGLCGVQLRIRALNSDVCKIRRTPHVPEPNCYVSRRCLC